MMRLIRVELTRFGHRRATKGFLALVLAIASVTALFVFVNSEQQPTNEQAIERADRERAACEADAREFFAANEGDLGFRTEADWVEQQCGRIRPANFFQDNRFCFVSMVTNPDEPQGCERADRIASGAEIRRFQGDEDDIFPGYLGILPIASTALLLLSVILPASFVGAEYRTGTMENLLLWEPRRIRVAGAKYLAGMIAAAVIHVGVLLFILAAFFPVALLHGTLDGTNGEFWGIVVSTLVRGAIGAALVSVIAMALAHITRYSAGAMVVMLGYIIGAGFAFSVFLQGFVHREILLNTQAFVRGSDMFEWRRVRRPQGFIEDEFTFHHGSLASGLHLAVWAALAVGASLWLLQRRDID